jgi:serine/threonine protein phosphatase 1
LAEFGVRTVRSDKPVAVIGDVHGRASLLRELLVQLGDVNVVSVGDVVDRGEDARDCVQQLIDRGAVGVLGNHEQWMRDLVSGGGFDRFALSAAMGGEATLRSYGIVSRTPAGVVDEVDKIPPDHQAWYRSLVDLVDLQVGGKSYWVAHSAPERDELPDGAGDDAVCGHFDWQAASLRWRHYNASRVTRATRPFVVGHVCRDTPHVSGACIGIDTGSGTTRNDTLTAVLLPALRLVSVRTSR